ncbi:MAG: DUF4266 domain-containing protein [Bacteroidota bacterium]
MRKHRIGSSFFLLLCFCWLLTSCTTVKPYQKMYLNDQDMKLQSRKDQSYVQNCENYREGASGATGGAFSSGCGCN